MTDTTPSADPAAAEVEALAAALAAEHAAVWGYGVVGAALPGDQRAPAVVSERAHRDARDALAAALAERGADAPGPEGGYELPFPVLSPTDAATLAVTLEDGVAAAWVRLLGDAAEPATRQVAVDALAAAEVRAVGWRTRAGTTPVTDPFPGLPD